ncbi:flagellar hook-length control protein FliK [Massilia sp. H6]|uniref:flagellar hook-length control protein FliK n=1 Tax=Massilia sp. H6 TaxID=2970464 RepID=UPI0021693A06|nr:flagellar hook-length control protein FliK [Massilia sp. H6]UVW27892.1 flagellar hook-length control protein FliK [Massilia sp. H6]
MTMQTTPFPFQASGANALQQAPQRNAAAGVQAPDPGQFRSTLSREMAQRQPAPVVSASPPPAQSPDPARKPVAASKPTPDKAVVAGPKAPAREPARQKEAASESGAAAAVAEGAQDSADAAQSATAAAEAATTPVTDMLAFMASLMQPAPAAPATPVPGEAHAAAGADVQLAALQRAAAPLDTDAASASLAGATEGDPGASLVSGVQPAADDAAGLRSLPQGQQPAVQADPKALPGERQAGLPLAAAIEAPPAPLTQLQAQASRLDALAPAGVPGDRIPARVGTPAWDNQVSQRIVYMVGKEQAATLTLNPPDLGPVQVVLNVSNEGTSVAFSSGEMEVRQALEHALPRLREMMSESGITLGNATVDAGTGQQRHAQDGERRANGSGRAGLDNHDGAPGLDDDLARPATRTVMLGDSGLVDTFA